MYQPDSNSVVNPSLFTAVDVIETGIPGRELIFMGSLTGTDSSGSTLQSFYGMQVGSGGVPHHMDMFEDLSPFLFTGPRGYAICFDGMQDLYYASGSNDNQVVVKADLDGNYKWGTRVNHHEFYDIVCQGTDIVFLGQDESIQGLHDFSIGRMDSSGTVSPGMMMGTTEFEIPERMIAAGNDYLMAGESFQNSSFNLMLVKADHNFNTIWGNNWALTGRDIFCKGVVEAPDGSGYVYAGRLGGGGLVDDSLFLFKTDTAGQPTWLRSYGMPGIQQFACQALEVDPAGGYFIGGSFKSPAFNRAFILKTDADGQIDWARDYSDAGPLTDESINAIVLTPGNEYFYAVGNHLFIDSIFSERSVMMIKAHRDTGATSCDQALPFGMANQTFTVGPPLHEEPFQASSVYDFHRLPGNVTDSTSCMIITGISEELPRQQLRFNNPADQLLHLKSTLPISGGTLRIIDLRGTVVLEVEMEGEIQENEIHVGNLPSGLYLIQAHGPDWRSTAQRLLIMH